MISLFRLDILHAAVVALDPSPRPQVRQAQGTLPRGAAKGEGHLGIIRFKECHEMWISYEM